MECRGGQLPIAAPVLREAGLSDAAPSGMAEGLPRRLHLTAPFTRSKGLIRSHRDKTGPSEQEHRLARTVQAKEPAHGPQTAGHCKHAGRRNRRRMDAEWTQVNGL
jgi:hypothetical protein